MGGPGGGGLLGLLMVEEVRKELELIEDQLADLRQVGESLRGERPAGERPNFREMSEADREKYMQQMRQEREAMAKKAREKLADILLPNQLERLQQINIQVQGVNALADEDVDHLAAAMDPGSVAGVLVYENLWAAPFGSAMRRAGGQLIANGRIPVQAIIAAIEADAALEEEGV